MERRSYDPSPEKAYTKVIEGTLIRAGNTVAPISEQCDVIVTPERVGVGQEVVRLNNQRLEKAFDKCLATLEAANVPVDFDPRRATWNDVLKHLDRVRMESERRQAKWSRRVRQTIAKVGVDLGPWLQLVPNEHGLSALNGGLALLFLTATIAEENRAQILAAFDELPATLQKAADKLIIGSPDVRLQISVRELYETILLELPPLIELLLHTTTKNRLLAPFRTKSNNDDIQERLSRIKNKVDSLDDVAVTLTQQATFRTFEGVSSLHVRQDQSISLQHRSISLIEQGLSDQKQSHQDLRALFENWDKQSTQRLLKLVEDDEDEAMTRLVRTRLHEELRRIERSRHQDQAFLSPATLRAILDVNPSKAANDLGYILKKSSSFGAGAKGQAEYLLQRGEFDHWFWSPEPDLLVVNGNFSSPGCSRISPLSLLCAKLLQKVFDPEHGVVIHFFCSENTPLQDTCSGPQRLMRSLLEQLLSALESRDQLNLEFVDSRKWHRELSSWNLKTMCETFWKLVNQLNMVSLYCIIDGLSLYERSDWKGDVLLLCNELEEMIEDDALRPRLKILITNPGRAKYIGTSTLVDRLIFLRKKEISHGGLYNRYSTVPGEYMG